MKSHTTIRTYVPCADMYNTSVIEDSSRVTLKESLCKELHDTVNLLRLSRQVEAGEEHPGEKGEEGERMTLYTMQTWSNAHVAYLSASTIDLPLNS